MADMTKHAKLCKAVESAYSGILLKEEQAAIVNAVLAEIREPDDRMLDVPCGVVKAANGKNFMIIGARDVMRSGIWQAIFDAIGDN